jgi:hypothetical protein
LLTPGAATASSADLLAAIVSISGPPAPPRAAWIERRATSDRTSLDNWDEWLVPDGAGGVLSKRVRLTGLPVRAREAVDLYIDGAIAASALVTTLPDRLPAVGEKPLTIMLGSCFCVAEDKIGRAGARFATLPGGLAPDLKLLSGDQVYLDAPFYQFLFPRTRKGLAKTFLRRYYDTWTQSGDEQGFRQVLSSGAAFFTSDDHEFWNNAPFPSFAVNTFTAGGRRTWWELASALFKTFQAPGPSSVQQIDVGELSIFVADLRLKRSSDRTSLLDPAELQTFKDWCAGLRFPGLLLVGAPMFSKKAGWSGRVADWNLPDFAQYADICRALLAAPQSIVMLTGDVHYGRVAQARLTSGHELLEIIASPMSLVTGGGAREWKGPPAMFPDEAIAGLVQAPVTALATWQRAVDHFLTLELWQRGGRLELRVRTWETAPDSETPTAPVFEYALQRRM